MSAPIYITTSIPYVNAAPHLGHGLEFVQADVFARYHRARGAARFLSGTDDNASKNVRAAEPAGVPGADSSTRNAPVRRARASARRVARRLHPHQRRPPPPGRRRAAVAAPAPPHGDLYRATTRALLRRLRAVLHADELVTAAVRSTARALETSSRRTGSSASRATSEALERPDRRRAPARSTPSRAATRCSRSWPAASRTSASPAAGRAPGVGDRRAGRPRAGDVRLVRRLANYITALGTAPRRARAFGTSGPAPTSGCTPSARASALPRRLLAGDAAGRRAAAAGHPLRPRVPDRGRREVSKSRGNGVDPVAGRRGVGADALRWWALARRAARRRRRLAGRACCAAPPGGSPTASATSSTGRSR